MKWLNKLKLKRALEDLSLLIKNLRAAKFTIKVGDGNRNHGNRLGKLSKEIRRIRVRISKQKDICKGLIRKIRTP